MTIWPSSDAGVWAGTGFGEEMNKHVVHTVPGEALAFALVLIKISASICVTSEGLQGRVMEVCLQWPSQLKKKN